MAGLIPIRTRDGNRLEYLSHYILSAFGAAVPVMRTEDVGVDLYCALGTAEAAGITIGTTFGVQLKSGENPQLTFGGTTSGGTWKDYEIKWFLNLESPLLFGVPHADQMRLDLYSLSIVRFVTVKDKLPFKIKIMPSSPGKSEAHIHPDLEGQNAGIEHVPQSCDGRVYTYKIGPPIISCSIDDLNNEGKVTSLKKRLTELLKYERLNSIYRALGLPYWYWPLEIETNVMHRLGYAYDEDRAAADRPSLLAETVPFVCALALSYLKEKEFEKLELLRGIFAQLPKDKIPEHLQKQLAVILK